MLFLLPAIAAEDRVFKDGDLKKFGQSLGKYFQAISDAEDIEKAQASLHDAIAKLEKKAKGRSLLTTPADIGRGFWLSRNLSKAKVKKGKVTKAVRKAGSAAKGEVQYAYRLPKTYNAAKSTYPLILTIPDEGVEPENHIKEQWLLNDIHDNAIILCVSMPGNRDKWTELMLDGEFGGLGNLMTCFGAAQELFSIDFDRVFVVGRGAGVPAAIAIGNYFPYRFAGIIGRKGDTENIGPENFSNLPCYFAGAGKNATAFKDAAEAAGHKNVTIAPSAKETDIWDWMKENPRTTYPTKVALTPGNVEGVPFPTRAYWLGVSPSEGSASLTGRIDRAKNTVYIDGEGVPKVTLYLNDQLVDLESPVKVICNGVENEAVLQRRLSVTLEFLKKGTSDSNCIYVSTQTFALPAKASADSE
ncbi:MAG: hypothetical protein ACI841_001439 [Planctomycetota bacterium]